MAKETGVLQFLVDVEDLKQDFRGIQSFVAQDLNPFELLVGIWLVFRQKKLPVSLRKSVFGIGRKEFSHGPHPHLLHGVGDVSDIMERICGEGKEKGFHL